MIELLIQCGTKRGLNPQRRREGECSAALISLYRHPVMTMVKSPAEAHGLKANLIALVE